jgi:hypothetical protein
MYSIDEQELVTKEAPKPAAVEAPPTPKRTAKQIAQEAKAKLEAGE